MAELTISIPMVLCTRSALAEAFTEWERRYREEPEEFLSDVRRLTQETPETYGDACAVYLMMLLNEQSLSAEGGVR